MKRAIFTPLFGEDKGKDFEATRPDDQSDWNVDNDSTGCPVCGEQVIGLSYSDEVKRLVDGRESAPFWCHNRHQEPIGILTSTAPVESKLPGRLFDIAGRPEFFRCRIY